MNELERWTIFYLLISAAAATLIGLLFAVITFGAERIVEDGPAEIRMYLTPTVLYLASALFLPALLTVPKHTRFAVSLRICLVSVARLIHSDSFLVGRAVRRITTSARPYRLRSASICGIRLDVFGGVLFFQASQRELTLSVLIDRELKSH